ELAVSKYNSTDNDLGVNWGLATSAYGAGDLGTPGAVNDFTLSNEQFTKNSFKLFPNPVSGNEITISVENGNPIDVIIYSALGQQVISQKAVTNSINVSSLNAGLYIVKVSQNGNSQTRKLVVQ
ncbi:T9SS type A sorting domain-containing protein, partial [Nonlabens mediterrranea]|nr:T9SS type A sorting domain-containing protein [Nonlabens mediterrranea]